ncbi:MAG: hypothetical protein H6Q74_2820 [Firmicutes bacterium]|nr:hypothetical protein [Bacillota bacterium]
MAVKTIISASRRTDLPKYHYSWLQQVLAEGQAVVANPRFSEKCTMVNLRPENVHSIVLWSKDFANVANAVGQLAGYNLYFQYTINNYAKRLEPNVPEYYQSLDTLERLLVTYRPEQFNIRFDPVMISTWGELTPTTKKPGQARLLAFTALCRDLASLGMQNARITTSYVEMYRHVKKRLGAAQLKVIDLNQNLQIRFFVIMAEIAASYGFKLYACASSILAEVPGIIGGRCIDGYLLESLFGGKVSKAKDTGQRSSCQCHKSTDIGDYHKLCGGGCLYCYATWS